ncbi:MAG: hypothetical protein AAB675_04590 [Patescibacteria group bacterium]
MINAFKLTDSEIFFPSFSATIILGLTLEILKRKKTSRIKKLDNQNR